jgi:hypothetical protein
MLAQMTWIPLFWQPVATNWPQVEVRGVVGAPGLPGVCVEALRVFRNDIGKTALANDFLRPEEVKNHHTCLPLRVVLCPDCSLVQLADTVDPKIFYSHYACVTSTPATMEAHLNKQAAHFLAWKFAPEIIRRETDFQRRGGRFIVPIPGPKIIPFERACLRL